MSIRRHHGSEVTHSQRHLAELDAARCNEQWAQVPELTRKIARHTPNRTCLIEAAQLDAHIGNAVAKAPSGSSTQRFSDVPSSAVEALAKSLPDADNDQSYREDAYQARATLAWLAWAEGKWRPALDVLPKTSPTSFSSTKEDTEGLSEWTIVCAIKSAYVQGSSEDALNSNTSYAAELQLQRLRELLQLPLFERNSPQHRFWLERYLCRCCEVVQSSLPEGSTPAALKQPIENALVAFRSWGRFWDCYESQGFGSLREDQNTASPQRRRAWKKYYDFLTELLRRDSDFTKVNGGDQSIAKLHEAGRKGLVQELQHVEAVCQKLILQDFSFPEASQVNLEVDKWCDQIVSNWTILAAPEEPEETLGPGGKLNLGRRILQSLYHAATRTYQSNTILRLLFTVHAALGDFDLAQKALDTYIDVVSQGKVRMQKSGEPEPGIDTDENMLETLAAGIIVLCEYGRREHAQRAQAIADSLCKWLDEHKAVTSIQTRGGKRIPHTEADDIVSGSVLAKTHRAIGIARARWARLTYDAASRSSLRAAAITHLRQASACNLHVDDDPYLLYPLALVLAETRDVEAAIAVCKRALAGQSKAHTLPINRQQARHDVDASINPTISRVECWHLLALLLSARAEFQTAEAAAQAALDQVYGKIQASDTAEALQQALPTFLDRQRFISAKITQVYLVEVNLGTDDAVSGVAELIELYARLFGPSETRNSGILQAKSTRSSAADSKSIAGTHRSFRRSFFGGARDSKRSSVDRSASKALPNPSKDHELSSSPSATPERMSAAQSLSHRLHKRRSRKSLQFTRASSPASRSRAPADIEETEVPNKQALGDQSTPSVATTNGVTSSAANPPPPMPDAEKVGLAVTHDLRASVTAQLDAMTLSALAAAPDPEENGTIFESPPDAVQPADQSVLPFEFPPPTFPEQDIRRYELSILCQVWLCAAALYRRAGLYDDAQGAVEEAFRQAKSVESAAASVESSVLSFETPGWAGMPSVEEVWANAYTEMGFLSVARGQPHEAVQRFEGALSHMPDHPGATVGISDLLLDIYAEKATSPMQPGSQPTTSSLHGKQSPTLRIVAPDAKIPSRSTAAAMQDTEPFPSVEDDGDNAEPTEMSTDRDESPDALNRLAARDRAYGLLSSLTKLGSGWDNSDAWYALARAQELSGQPDKAQEILWWVVELEDKRPVRDWHCLGPGYCLRV